MCLTLCDPMDCNLPGSSIHGILQARILEWVAISFSSVSSKPRDGTWVFCTAGRLFTIGATREEPPHASKVMLKILQVRLQQYVNCEIPDVPAGFRKGRGTRDQIANICWIIEKAREFQKNIYFCFIDYAKAYDNVDHNKLWEILREMGIPDHLTCLLRNLYAGQEGTVRTGHRTTDGFQIGKRLHQGCILSLCLFNLDVLFSSVAQSCPTLCDPMNHSMPGLPVHHHLPEFTQIHVHRASDAIQPSHPLSSPSPPAPNPSQHHSLFQ